MKRRDFKSRILGILGRAHPTPLLSPEEGYRLWAPEYTERMNPVQVLEEEALKPLFPDVRGLSVLDVGCGTGRLCHWAERREARQVTGLDLSAAMLVEARRASPSSRRWVQGEAGRLPFRERRFDVVVSGLMMGHIEDLGAALGEMSRLLAPQGTLLVTDFHPSAVEKGWKRTFQDPVSQRTYEIRQHLHSFSDYRSHFKRLGLSLEKLEERSYKGTPVVFALRAKSVSGEAPEDEGTPATRRS